MTRTQKKGFNGIIKHRNQFMTILPSLGAKGFKRSLNPFPLRVSTLLEFSHAASVHRAPATASSALML